MIISVQTPMFMIILLDFSLNFMLFHVKPKYTRKRGFTFILAGPKLWNAINTDYGTDDLGKQPLNAFKTAYKKTVT